MNESNSRKEILSSIDRKEELKIQTFSNSNTYIFLIFFNTYNKLYSKCLDALSKNCIKS